MAQIGTLTNVWGWFSLLVKVFCVFWRTWFDVSAATLEPATWLWCRHKISPAALAANMIPYLLHSKCWQSPQIVVECKKKCCNSKITASSLLKTLSYKHYRIMVRVKVWWSSFKRNHGNREHALGRVQIKGSKTMAQRNKENTTHIFHWAKWGSAVWTHQGSRTVRRKVLHTPVVSSVEADFQTDVCKGAYDQGFSHPLLDDGYLSTQD